MFGTRPEAIKLCPVVLHLRQAQPDWTVRVCVTGQHRDMLDQVLTVFGVEPDYDLQVMEPGQTLAGAAARILTALEDVLRQDLPTMVIVQGDTTTTFAGALAAFYAKIPVGHVEAGLRTKDMAEPFPEEMNRVLTTRLAALHFAPTETARQHLLAEGVRSDHVFVTGNPGIDAVLQIRERMERGAVERHPLTLASDRKMILVTVHRRESFGEGIENICRALGELARRPDVEIVLPVHPNPHVGGVVREWLGGLPSVHLLPPLGYVDFTDLMCRAYLLLTDSGGVQEEGPSLSKPVLVLREKTERPEAVEAGTARLVGRDPERIIRETELLLDNPAEYQSRAYRHNPYGDGHASERIANILRDKLHPI